MALISPWQAIYAVGLAVLFWWRGPSPAAWVLLADFIAILLIAGAMDMGWLGRDGATRSMLVVWCVSTAILATQPAKIMAVFGAIGAAAFIAAVTFGVHDATTSAIVNPVAFIMLAVALYGMGGNGGGGYRVVSDRAISVDLSGRDYGRVQGGVAQDAGLLSENSRGLE